MKLKTLFAVVLSATLFVSTPIFSCAAPSLITVNNDISNPNIPISVTVASYSGHGDSVLSGIALPEGYSYKATFTHDGKRNFAIWSYYDTGNKELLVNEIGNYAGTTLIDSGKTNAKMATLEIKADGNWTVFISTITNSSTRSLSGSGDKVTGIFMLDKSNTVVTLNNIGNSNFAVWAYFSDGRRDLLANEIGNYTGQVLLKNKPNVTGYLEITSSGQWTIDLGYGDISSVVPDIN